MSISYAGKRQVEYLTEIIVAAITTLGVVATAVFGYLSNQKTRDKNKRLEAQVAFHRGSFAFSAFLEHWPKTATDIRRLIEETEIDRFLVLRACNGLEKPTHTTAVYQMRATGQEAVAYVYFELDDHYRDILKESKEHLTHLIVEQMPISFLKEVYQAEGVTESIIGYVGSEVLPHGAVAHTYCSFATHEGAINAETKLRCRLILDQLKGIVNQI